MGNVAIIDDDAIFCDLLANHCQLQGHDTLVAGTIEEGKKLLAATPIDLVFLDVRLPDGNGLNALPFIQGLPSSPEVIIITGMGDSNGAHLAIKNGAWDYLQKPLSREAIILQIRRAFEYHAKKMERPARIRLKRDEIIGENKAICDCLDQVAHCAGSETGALVYGETGTGKELFARAIHANSARAMGPFIVVDCASLPENLVESILFGHVKGAFTGAGSDHKGLIEQANGGTLFLDEVGELPLEIQGKFLRVLQERVYRPVGKEKEYKSNFRLIAATNRDLSEMVAKGLFRSDLYFRLFTFMINLPPLREWGKEIEQLIMSYVVKLCNRNRLPVKGVLPETFEMLAAYSWPGNVRELVNVLEKTILSDPYNPMLYPIHLPPEIRLQHIYTMTSQRNEQPLTASSNSLMGLGNFQADDLPPLKKYRRILYNEIEKHYLQRLMSRADANIAAACKISGLSRSRLYVLLKFHSLTDAVAVDLES